MPLVTKADIDKKVDAAVAAHLASLGLDNLIANISAMASSQSLPAALRANLDGTQSPPSTMNPEWDLERQTYETLLAEADKETEVARAERDTAHEELHRLRESLNELRRKGISLAPAQASYPEDLSGLADWLETNPQPNIVITTKAYRSMRRVRYNDMERLCKALMLLNGPYVDMRAGEDGARSTWEQGLMELRLENRKQSQMGKGVRGGNEYRFEHDGYRWDMDYHLRGTESLFNDHDRLLRIYYAYDKAEGRVLIAHLPTHLTTVDS